MNPNSESHVGYGSERRNGKREYQDAAKFKKSKLIWITIAFLLTILLATVSTALFAIRQGKSHATESTNNGTVKHCVHALNNETKICYTKQCVNVANHLLTYMDSDRDPCEDFYKFACGKFISNNEMIYGHEKDDYEIQNVIRVGRQLKEILDKPHKPNDSEALDMAKKYYKSCLNYGNQMQQKQFIHEKTRILKVIGDWPALVGNWTPPLSYSWEEQLVHIIRFGVDAILKIEVSDHPEKSAQNCIWINMLSSYFNLLPVIDNETALNDSQDLQMMISAMAKVPYDTSDWKVKSIKDLKTDLPNVNWNTIFSIFPAKLNVSDNDDVVIMSWKQFKNTMNIISTSSRRVVQNYIYQLLENNLMMRSPIVIKNICSPTETICASLEEYCKSATSLYLPQIVGAQYAATWTDEKQKTELQILARQLRTTLITKINEARWLDDKTRAHALAKIDQMITVVGYPKNSFNKTLLMQSYKNLDIKENDFFKNTIKIQNANLQQTLNSLRDPVERGNLFFDSFEINAMYVQTRNLMVITTAYLQLAALSREVPAYMIYAQMGYIVGHEITHGFDSTGHLFNEHGNLEDWWDAHTYKKYLRKQECFRNQFNNIIDPISGERLNGNKSLGENMADTGGLNLAYTAFMKLLSKNSNMPKLPGLDSYTPEQLFFLIFGNFQCSVYSQTERKMALQGEHSLDSYRVNYSLKNLREFGDAFKCPKTAKMRIKNPCTMW